MTERELQLRALRYRAVRRRDRAMIQYFANGDRDKVAVARYEQAWDAIDALDSELRKMGAHVPWA